MIIDYVGRNRVTQCDNGSDNGFAASSDREVYYLCLGRLNDITDNITLFYRDYPGGVDAGWIKDKRSKVRVLPNRKCGHIRISSRRTIPIGDWR